MERKRNDILTSANRIRYQLSLQDSSYVGLMRTLCRVIFGVGSRFIQYMYNPSPAAIYNGGRVDA